MSGISSHILDTSRGLPAGDVEVQLELKKDGEWQLVGGGRTDRNGRIPELIASDLVAGHYRIIFLVADYFVTMKKKTFYPTIRIEFTVDDPAEHYHVPLLLNPYGYTTYRGS